MDFLIGLGPILLVALGLGFVIFIHELGHFAVAKWADVKVDKFSIGFGPTLVGFQRGETYYSLSIIPLGGFVKMLGENPTEDGQEAQSDPRSYLNKTVGARMAIISAGVIMNLITGFFFFFFAYRFGLPYIPAEVGAVVPGSPAYQAGIRPGDSITAVDGKTGVTFEDFFQTVSLSGHGQSVRLDMKRAENGDAYDVLVTPVVRPDRLKPEVGLGFPVDSTVAATGFRKLPGTVGDGKNTEVIKDRDRIVGIAGPSGDFTKVNTLRDLNLALSRLRAEPVRLQVASDDDKAAAPREVTIPPAKAMGLGLVFQAMPIEAVQPESPAAKAGIKKGESIVTVDGKPMDPLTLPSIAFDFAGRELKLEVENEAGEKRQVSVTPRLEPLENEEPFMSDYQNVPSLGICFFITPRVVTAMPGGAGAKAGFRTDNFLTRVKLTLPKDQQAAPKQSLIGAISGMFKGIVTQPAEQDNSVTYLISSKPNDGPDPTYPDLDKITILQFVRMLSKAPVEKIEIARAAVENTVTVSPEPESGLFMHDRGLLQYRQVRDLPPQPYSVCLSRAMRDIPDSVRQVIGTIRSLLTQRVSKKLLGGPVTIATTAYATASEGLGTFLKFLGMLSINLAVMNFLPIPPLDGGQMCFLMGEKLKGSPLPERVQVGFTMIGLSAVLSLMVVVLYQDLLRVFGLL